MELRHLRYFVAVAEELNFRRASQRLYISSPALSKQIKDLESELVVQLFNRDTGGVRLTEAGATFLTGARRTLAQSKHAMDLTREAAKGRHGGLAVGYVEPILMGFMPECLVAFHRRFPGVEVTLIELPLREQMAAVASGAVQIGFTLTGGAGLPAGVQHGRIADSPLRAVVGREHRFAKLKQVALADLVGERLVSLRLKAEAISPHRELMQQIFSGRGLKGRMIKEIEGTEAFRANLASGLGVSLVPAIGGLAHHRRISMKPLADTGPDLTVGLDALWSDHSTSRIAENFVALLRKVAGAEKLCSEAANG